MNSDTTTGPGIAEKSSYQDPKSYYSALRSVNPIEAVTRQLLGEHITSESGGTLQINCPCHDSASRKSLHVTPAAEQWFCFGCTVGGDVIQLVEFVQTGGRVTKGTSGVMPDSHRAARDWLAERVGMPPMAQIGLNEDEISSYWQKEQLNQRALTCLTEVAHWYHECLMRTPDMLEWLQDNYALSIDFIIEQQIGYSNNWAWKDKQGEDQPSLIRNLIGLGFTLQELLSTGAFISKVPAGETLTPNALLPWFVNRLTFPYWHNNQAIYMIARQCPPSKEKNRYHETTQDLDRDKAKYKKLLTHSERHPEVAPIINNSFLHNEDILRTDPPPSYVVITEGITDNLAAMNRKIPAISPVTTTIKHSSFDHVVSQLKNVDRVYVCLDSEVSKVGNEAAYSLAEKLSKQGVNALIVELPLTTAKQTEARAALTDQFGWHADMNRKQVVSLRVGLSDNSDKVKEFDKLAKVAKQDINSYFLSEATIDDFKALLDAAGTWADTALAPYFDRIRRKDASVLEDIIFLDLATKAKKHAPGTWYQLTQAAGAVKMARILESTVVRHERHGGGNGSPPPVPVRSALQTAKTPFPPGIDLEKCDLQLPPFYSFNESGAILRTVQGRDGDYEAMVAGRPVLITSRRVNIDTGDEFLTIAHYGPEGWKSTTQPRTMAMDNRQLLTLAGLGIPVASSNVRDLGKFLADFEDENIGIMPLEMVRGALGWIDHDRQSSFLWGKIQLPVPSITPPALHQSANKSPDVHFHPTDAGNAQFAAGFYQSGTLDGWLTAFAELCHFPVPLIATYAALAAPLINILDCENIALDISGRTSTGKTKTLEMAGSVWGNPNIDSKKSAVGTWDSTHVGIEQRCATCCDLPVILDDTTKAVKPEAIARSLYGIISGQGRMRGSLKGARQTLTWRTVLISSGEGALTSYSEHGGTRARILSLTDMPFGTDSPATRDLVNRIESSIHRNFGHAGPLFVNWLITNRSRWTEFRDRYHERTLAYTADSSGSVGIESRLAKIAAVISLAGQLFHEALAVIADTSVIADIPTTTDHLPLPFKFHDPFTHIWPSIRREAYDAPIDIRALNAAYSWAVRNASRFYGHHGLANDNRPIAPPGGWAGRWNNDLDWEFIGFDPQVLKAELARMGFSDFDAIVRGWQDRGWLISSDDGRFGKPCRVNGKLIRLICVNRDAIDYGPGSDLSDLSDYGRDTCPQELQSRDIQSRDIQSQDLHLQGAPAQNSQYPTLWDVPIEGDHSAAPAHPAPLDGVTAHIPTNGPSEFTRALKAWDDLYFRTKPTTEH